MAAAGNLAQELLLLQPRVAHFEMVTLSLFIFICTDNDPHDHHSNCLKLAGKASSVLRYEACQDVGRRGGRQPLSQPHLWTCRTTCQQVNSGILLKGCAPLKTCPRVLVSTCSMERQSTPSLSITAEIASNSLHGCVKVTGAQHFKHDVRSGVHAAAATDANLTLRTTALVIQRAISPACAAVGATRVPNDHSATPASNTFAPPILQSSILSSGYLQLGVHVPMHWLGGSADDASGVLAWFVLAGSGWGSPGRDNAGRDLCSCVPPKKCRGCNAPLSIAPAKLFGHRDDCDAHVDLQEWSRLQVGLFGPM